jgi:hypothetical protein
MSKELRCPLCDYPLSMENRYDGETLEIDFGCEGFGDDEFHFIIKVPLTFDELIEFETGDKIKKEVTIEVVDVRPEEDYE